MLTIASRLDAMNRLGRALADPTRCRILLALLDSPEYPALLAERLQLTRSNVSNHLACLRGCGLIAATPQGRQMRYEIADPHLTQALSELLGVVLAVDTCEPCVDGGPATTNAGDDAADWHVGGWTDGQPVADMDPAHPDTTPVARTT